MTTRNRFKEDFFAFIDKINSSTISWWDALLEYMRAEAYLIK